jgi:hypothetical protein
MTIRTALVALAAFTLFAPHAFAQDPSAAAQITSGPMTVERVHSGWLAAPDVKITSVDHATSALAGVYGGFLSNELFFVGGAGYWLANNHSDRRMGYGGVVAGLMAPTDRAVGFGAKVLFGYGTATLGTTVTEAVFPPIPVPLPGQRPVQPAPTFRTTTVLVHDGFGVAEPEANLLVNFSRNVRLAGGVGYRFAGDDRVFGHRLSGATASLSLQIGGR